MTYKAKKMVLYFKELEKDSNQKQTIFFKPNHKLVYEYPVYYL